MKRVIAVLVGVVALALTAAFAARACEKPLPTAFCVGGKTVTPTGRDAYTLNDAVLHNDGVVYVKTWTQTVDDSTVTHTVYRSHGSEDGGWTAVSVSVGACPVAAPPPNEAFLCYSSSQSNPGVWSMNDAAALMKQGYWSPYAVPGNVDGGTNVGSYHLVCNLASGQSASDSTLGGAGETYGAGEKQDVQNVPGHYPVAGS